MNNLPSNETIESWLDALRYLVTYMAEMQDSDDDWSDEIDAFSDIIDFLESLKAE